MTRAASAARGEDCGCGRCGTSTGEIHWCEELALSLCADCFLAMEPSPPQSSSSEIAVPRSSFLVPCPTDGASGDDPGREAELDELLRLHRAGVRKPLQVELPPLPSRAAQAVRDVAEFFAVVRGLRLSAGDERDVPFAVRWVAEKVAWPKATVDRALSELVEAGVLVRGEVLPPRGQPRGTQCYRPGVVDGSKDELAARRGKRAPARGGGVG